MNRSRVPALRVAVIGAGWSGLAAAIELVEGGAEVTLHEMARHPGGRARSALADGRRLDNGLHILIGAYTETLGLMRRVGVDPAHVLMRLPLAMCGPTGRGDLVDIGIGRLVAHTSQQARELVDKLLGYDALQLLRANGTSCSTTGDGGIADWRTHVLFVSDDQEGDGFESTIHMEQSDFLATRVETEHPDLNVDKLYMDAYQQISTPRGERYPDAIEELREKVQKGQLLVNYVGHGGEVGWAHERLLDNNTILGWTNKDRLPLFMTATC